MNVPDYIAWCLKKHVSKIFGYQGSAILKLVDAIVAADIEYVQTYHEQAAAMAADAYARITGGLGVAIATSGPGVTNLVTGIANAYFDSTPTLFITGQAYTTKIEQPSMPRQNGFQEVDAVALCKPITKYAKKLLTADEVPFEIEKAIHSALSGRPGSVLLDIPLEVQFYESENFSPSCYIQEDSSPLVNEEELNTAFTWLKSAKRPVILAGGGIRLANAVLELTEFGKKTHIPAVSTLNGLDVYDASYGFSGLQGCTPPNLLVNNADVLLVLGSRFGIQHVGKNKAAYTGAKVIHVDIDIHERNRGLNSALFIHADLKQFMSGLNDLLRKEPFTAPEHWRTTATQWHDRYKDNVLVNMDGIDPVVFVREITKFCSDSCIFTVDVGQNQMWVAQGFRKRGEQRLLNSSGHGAMGFSLPAAIGAKFAAPERQTVAFMGDGGLQMNIQELMTLGHRKIPVTCIVFNNETLGMMREVQIRYFESRFHGASDREFACPNLKLLAAAYGLEYLLVDSMARLPEVEKCLSDSRPWIVDVRISKNSKLLNRYDEKHIFEIEKLTD